MTRSTERRLDAPPERRAPPYLALWLGGILLATLAFWKFRIIDSATILHVGLNNSDLYVWHYPMTKWGFERLFAGEIPHWNPHQLTGLPFQAMPVGLFYPGNLIYGVMETAAATELSLIGHLFFAGAGTFMLCRAIGFSPRAGLMAAFTFMWSGWMIFYSNQPSLISGMSWMPTTILMVELTLRGRRCAAFGLIGAVAFQLLIGATEFFVHNMYVAGGYTLLRLSEFALRGEWRLALQRGVLLLGSVVCGVLLAAPQILPTMELVSESVRARDLSFAQAVYGSMPPGKFIVDALMSQHLVTVGVLPLAGVFIGVTTRNRRLWGFSLVLVVLGAFLAFGGPIFRLYYETPLGAMFRRPQKFLHIYAFGQALMAAMAVMALETWCAESRRVLLRRPIFVVCLLALGGGAFFLLLSGQVPVALLLLLAGLMAFAFFDSTRLRSGVIVALLLLQTGSLFFGAKQTFIRPAASLKEWLHEHDPLFDRLAELSPWTGGPRVRIGLVRRYSFFPMKKAGMLRGLRVLGDYEALVSRRSEEFLRAVTPPPLVLNRRLFSGSTPLRADSDWDLLDLTATRFFLVGRGVDVDRYLEKQARQGPGSGVVLHVDSAVRLYERTTALPRAYFVTQARLVEGPGAALAALQAEGFSPYREVVLEGAPASMAEHGRGRAEQAEVVIEEDGRESVVITVRTVEPGFLVLSDAYHADWEARSAKGELPIYRANHLFRAVPLEVGETRIEMRYRARAFHMGLLLCGGTFLGLVGVALYLASRRRLPVG